MRRNSVSALAIASLTMGILSLLIFPFHMLHVALSIIGLLLAIGAIITGLTAIHRITFYPIRGKALAYAGVVTGANGCFFVVMSIIYRLV